MAAHSLHFSSLHPRENPVSLIHGAPSYSVSRTGSSTVTFRSRIILPGVIPFDRPGYPKGTFIKYAAQHGANPKHTRPGSIRTFFFLFFYALIPSHDLYFRHLYRVGGRSFNSPGQAGIITWIPVRIDRQPASRYGIRCEAPRRAIIWPGRAPGRLKSPGGCCSNCETARPDP